MTANIEIHSLKPESLSPHQSVYASLTDKLVNLGRVNPIIATLIERVATNKELPDIFKAMGYKDSTYTQLLAAELVHCAAEKAYGYLNGGENMMPDGRAQKIEAQLNLFHRGNRYLFLQDGQMQVYVATQGDALEKVKDAVNEVKDRFSAVKFPALDRQYNDTRWTFNKTRQTVVNLTLLSSLVAACVRPPAGETQNPDITITSASPPTVEVIIASPTAPLIPTAEPTTTPVPMIDILLVTNNGYQLGTLLDKNGAECACSISQEVYDQLILKRATIPDTSAGQPDLLDRVNEMFGQATDLIEKKGMPEGVKQLQVYFMTNTAGETAPVVLLTNTTLIFIPTAEGFSRAQWQDGQLTFLDGSMQQTDYVAPTSAPEFIPGGSGGEIPEELHPFMLLAYQQMVIEHARLKGDPWFNDVATEDLSRAVNEYVAAHGLQITQTDNGKTGDQFQFVTLVIQPQDDGSSLVDWYKGAARPDIGTELTQVSIDPGYHGELRWDKKGINVYLYAVNDATGEAEQWLNTTTWTWKDYDPDLYVVKEWEFNAGVTLPELTTANTVYETFEDGSGGQLVFTHTLTDTKETKYFIPLNPPADTIDIRGNTILTGETTVKLYEPFDPPSSVLKVDPPEIKYIDSQTGEFLAWFDFTKGEWIPRYETMWVSDNPDKPLPNLSWVKGSLGFEAYDKASKDDVGDWYFNVKAQAVRIYKENIPNPKNDERHRNFIWAAMKYGNGDHLLNVLVLTDKEFDRSEMTFLSQYIIIGDGKNTYDHLGSVKNVTEKTSYSNDKVINTLRDSFVVLVRIRVSKNKYASNFKNLVGNVYVHPGNRETYYYFKEKSTFNSLIRYLIQNQLKKNQELQALDKSLSSYPPIEGDINVGYTVMYIVEGEEE